MKCENLVSIVEENKAEKENKGKERLQFGVVMGIVTEKVVFV